MAFSFKEAFAHLDGKTMTYNEVMDEVIYARRRYLGELGPEINSHDLFYQMMQMGWMQFPDDGTSGDVSTCIFKICEDARVVRKRIDEYKQEFIRTQALKWLDEYESDGNEFPVGVDLKEYEQAVREVAGGRF